jgi:putative peptidoglycan lipid II flippase
VIRDPGATPSAAVAVGWLPWGGRLRNGSAHHQIVVALLTVAGAGSIVKVASMAKEVVIARQFGAGDDIDAFVIALLLPSFIVGLVAAAFQSAVIPTYVEVRDREGSSAARELVSVVTVCTCGLLVAFTGVLALAAPQVLPLIGSGFSPEKLALTQRLFYLLLPLVALTGVSAIWGAALNAEERFALVALAPIATPLLLIGGVLAVGHVVGIYALPAGLVLGSLAESCVLAYAVSRRRLLMAPRWRRAYPAGRTVMRQSVSVAAGSVIMGSTIVVDSAMAAMLPAGSVATLTFGSRFVLFLLAFGAGALSTAVLPQFSRLVARSDWSGLRDVVRSCLWWIVGLSVPLTALLIAFSLPLTRLMFERGAFTPEATAVVSRVQVLYLLQVPFYLIGIVLVRLISAFRSNHLLVWGAAINLGANVLLNWVFMRWMGVGGIALSTSCVYAISCGFLALASARLMRNAAASTLQSCA